MKIKKKKCKYKIVINIIRKNKDVGLYLKIPNVLEKFFKEMSNGKETVSKKWFYNNKKGVRFYQLTSSYTNNEMDLINTTLEYRFFNHYGDGLFRSKFINLAILRSVGANKGVRIFSSHFNNISNLALENYVRGVAEATKKIWNRFIDKKEIKSYIYFEI